MDQVERLDRLVDSILASVRIVPPEAATVTPTDVEAAIDEVVESIGPIVRQHRLDVRRGLGHFALADAPRLRQILEHLIENAVKYAPPDTTITIDHSLVEGSVRIGVTRPGPGRPRGVARADLRAVRPPRDAHRAGLRDRAVRREAARRIDGRAAVGRAGRADRRPLRPLPARPRPPSSMRS